MSGVAPTETSVPSAAGQAELTKACLGRSMSMEALLDHLETIELASEEKEAFRSRSEPGNPLGRLGRL